MATTYAAGISQQDGSMEHSECTSREHDLSWRHTTTAHSADKQFVLLQPSTRRTTAPARCSPAGLDVLAGTCAPWGGVKGLHFLLNKPSGVLLSHLCSPVPQWLLAQKLCLYYLNKIARHCLPSALRMSCTHTANTAHWVESPSASQ